MAHLEGSIVLSDLPPHGGLIVRLCLFPVEGPDSAPPFEGDPPPEAATDCIDVYEQVDLGAESSQSEYSLTFAAERPEGHYYLQVRAILFRMEAGKVFAQTEQFFFAHRPLPVPPPGVPSLPVRWPSDSIAELDHHGTVHPSGKS
jgi:hypothetical protein